MLSLSSQTGYSQSHRQSVMNAALHKGALEGSGDFRTIPESSGEFRKYPEISGKPENSREIQRGC
eukprot:11811725-Alexandrium_andersonii.AAC.1